MLVLAADANARLQAALSLERKGNDRAALAALRSLVRTHPAWELPRLEVARLLLENGDSLDEAEAHLEAARALAPENPRGHFLYGLLMQERGRDDDAAKAWELAVHYREDYDDARFRLGSHYFARGDWEKAERHLRLYARRNPEATGARINLALALEKLSRLEDAELELRKLYEAQPDSPLVVKRLVEFYERIGRPKLADKVRAAAGESKRKMRQLKPSRR